MSLKWTVGICACDGNSTVAVHGSVRRQNTDVSSLFISYRLVARGCSRSMSHGVAALEQSTAWSCRVPATWQTPPRSTLSTACVIHRMRQQQDHSVTFRGTVNMPDKKYSIVIHCSIAHAATSVACCRLLLNECYQCLFRQTSAYTANRICYSSKQIQSSLKKWATKLLS